MPTSRLVLINLAFHLAAVLGYDYGAINHGAEPYVVAMFNNASIGPDGPWWYISQAVDFPDQHLPMLPSISQTSLAINDSACRSQAAACPLPLPNMLTLSGAYQVSEGPQTQSDLRDASTWDEDYATLLNLSGSGRDVRDRMTLHRDSYNDDPVFLDGLAMGVSANYTVEYSTEAGYTMNAGFFSLNGVRDLVEWNAANGTTFSGNRTLPQAYQLGGAPSISYGLHIGSVEPNVTGSLVLGGYDISRCLTDPIVSSLDTVQLSGISMNVSSGGHAFLNSTSAYIPDLLRANQSTLSSLSVHPRPGVPHLYLPQETCDAIASHLPVTYSPEFNLYFWNTNDQAYKDIISSPHHLSFTFESDNNDNNDDQAKTIKVPFALLNLTLTSPIVSSTTQYFPCKPWSPSSPTGYTLGSAFLQAAFLAQNWQTNKLFLSQAPGPRLQSASVQKIGHADTTLTPAKNPPSWEVSWSDTLEALPTNASPSQDSDSNPDSSGSSSSSSSSSSDSSRSLSSGALAGIILGILACLALAAVLIWYIIRRKKRQQRRAVKLQTTPPENPASPFLQQYEDGNNHNTSGVPYLGKPALAPYEVDSQTSQVSELGAGREVAELAAEPGVVEKSAYRDS